MARCLYNSTIRKFLQLSPEALLGHFVNNYHGAALTTTNEAWANEIHIMQEVLQPWMDEDGQVIFEYDIPRLGKRIDIDLLLRVQGRRAGDASIQYRAGPGLCP